jgi:hypothetical protein
MPRKTPLPGGSGGFARHPLVNNKSIKKRVKKLKITAVTHQKEIVRHPWPPLCNFNVK